MSFLVHDTRTSSSSSLVVVTGVVYTIVLGIWPARSFDTDRGIATEAEGDRSVIMMIIRIEEWQ